METLQGFKKNEVYYVLNEHIYLKSSSGLRGKIYLKCKVWSCSATAIMERGVLTQKKEHNDHELLVLEIKMIKFRSELRKRSINDVDKPLNTIFLETQILYPEVAALIHYSSLQCVMRRARQEKMPPNPVNIDHFEELINKEEYCYLSNEIGENQQKFFNAIITSSEGNKNIYFSSPTIIAKIKNERRPIDLCIDGTFKVVPNLDDLKQLR